MKIQPLLERFAATIKGYIDKRVGELDIQIKSLPTPKDGRDATDPTDEHLDALIAKRIPEPIPGKDGASVEMDDVRKMLSEIQGAWASDFEQRAYAVMSAAIDKIPKDGKDGRDGVDGKSFSIDEATAVIERAIEARQSAWALDFERRAQELFQRAIERIPAPKDGKDGRDAIDVEGFDMSLDGRDLTVSLKRGDAVIASKSIRVPGFEDRGVYRDTEQYEKGDGVSFGGSFFIAQKDYPEGKPEQSRDWRLAIKKGRDGKDGRNGIDKTSAVKVP